MLPCRGFWPTCAEVPCPRGGLGGCDKPAGALCGAANPDHLNGARPASEVSGVGQLKTETAGGSISDATVNLLILCTIIITRIRQ